MSTLHEAAQALRDEQLLRAAYACIDPPRVPVECSLDEPELDPKNRHESRAMTVAQGVVAGAAFVAGVVPF